MLHGTLPSPDALLLVPLVLGYAGIAICIVVLVVTRWLGRGDRYRIPAATARRLAGRLAETE